MGIFAVTAQSQAEADQAVQQWGLNFKAWSDPQHKLRNYLSEEGLIDIVISGGENATDSGFYKVHPKIKLYKWGVAQPGVLCVNSEKKVLYSWAINPSIMNIGGASDRPVPADIWTVVQAKMNNIDSDQPIPRVRSRGACSICTVL